MIVLDIGRDIQMDLTITNLTKKFDNFTAVDNINVTMTTGVYGLLGVNGAGKTTLMRMLCTLLRPTEGKITCNGKDILAMDGDYRKILGYLPQDFGFYPEFTVKDYLLYISSIKGIKPIVAKKRVRELVAKVGLQKAFNKKMKNLSDVASFFAAAALLLVLSMFLFFNVSVTVPSTLGTLIAV